jgi:hypothetical protein
MQWPHYKLFQKQFLCQSPMQFYSDLNNEGTNSSANLSSVFTIFSSSMRMQLCSLPPLASPFFSSSLLGFAGTNRGGKAVQEVPVFIGEMEAGQHAEGAFSPW